MTVTRYTEKQILCGLYECWKDAMGTDRPFDAETRVDLHMKANCEWEETDLADLFFRFEKHFGFESSLEEWTEELGIANVPSLDVWENEMAPKFTFGALARFIQKRAVNTVSFKPVMVINKECLPAGAFYGIEQISNQLVSAKCRVTPSTKIIDAFRGYKLNSFWSELSWRSEVPLPQLSRHWDFLADWGYMITFWGMLIAFPLVFFMGNFYILLGAVLLVIAIWLIDSAYTHYSDPLPPELQTFRDLAMLIAAHDCTAVRKCEAIEHG
ncbi:MAG: hypothetical protein K0U86_03745 [Planctomycetes bacterium]|nr:hypothetical protein [Planctomycetota bacterium]MCH9723998.1 hypothetical protein [Planctomycetota bacterium]MCH9779540.1 hypothetical protein [Planctomycetota bacterium]MCH9792382.1 hypothetical protein [Planctomycetota bacterium]